MLFNSGAYLLFFLAFLLLYYLARRQLALRNGLIVAGSYFFYGWWDWRLLGLLFFSSVVDYAVGLGLEHARSIRGRRWLLVLSVVVNLGILGFFKYFNFFVESMDQLLAGLGVGWETTTLQIILPVGISFYTFQSMSYTIDVYRGVMKPTRKLINFLAYVSFFPQLVAGPIERAHHLLPQFEKTRVITLEQIREGGWLFIWGMFKKVVIADNLAPLVELAYNHPAPGAALVTGGIVAFGFQILCDFSGYSDIARGTAKFLGFDIMWNFRLPYLAGSVREFWHRWHISLATWLRDYLYIPLGGNRKGRLRTCMNLLTTMLLGGLWHGAAWTFVLWGLWHGLGLVIHRGWRWLMPEKKCPWVLGWITTMLFVFAGWLWFRAESLEQALGLAAQLGNWTSPDYAVQFWIQLVLYAFPLIAIQAWQHRTSNLLAPLNHPVLLPVLEGFMIFAIFAWWEKERIPFIYFQF